MAGSDEPVILSGTGDTLYQVMTRRDYIESLENLVDSIAVDLFVINTAGVVIVWNRSMSRRWCPKDAAIGSLFWEMLPQFLEEYEGYRLGESIMEGVVVEGRTIDLPRYPQRLRSGKLVVCDLKAYPLRGRGETILGAVVVMNDVTEQVLLEQQLVRHARTTSLANLGANMAHEIRNPLNSIQLNVELIQEGLEADPLDPAGLTETAEMVREEVVRLNELVTHFLEFARPSQPKLELASPVESVEFALRLLGEEAKRKQIEVERDLHPLPKIQIDRQQLSQAVYNIALNALQLMAPGGVLTVRSRARPDYLLVQVQDTGPGIPPESLDKLFDLFYSQREGGTGLGLPIANRIIETHGGRLVAENAGGGGAIFSIYLPHSGAGYHA